VGGRPPPPPSSAKPPPIAKPPTNLPVTPRPDVAPQAGGRSGQNVKDLTGPPNSAIPSASGDRIYITNDKGQVILDVTRDRAKEVSPGRGFGGERPPTPQELDLMNKVFPKK